MELKDKLEILADAAKYDASCAGSGAPKRDSSDKDGKPAHGASSSELLRRNMADAPQQMTRQMNLWPELQPA